MIMRFFPLPLHVYLNFFFYINERSQLFCGAVVRPSYAVPGDWSTGRKRKALRTRPQNDSALLCNGPSAPQLPHSFSAAHHSETPRRRPAVGLHSRVRTPTGALGDRPPKSCRHVGREGASEEEGLGVCLPVGETNPGHLGVTFFLCCFAAQGSKKLSPRPAPLTGRYREIKHRKALGATRAGRTYPRPSSSSLRRPCPGAVVGPGGDVTHCLQINPSR